MFGIGTDHPFRFLAVLAFGGLVATSVAAVSTGTETTDVVTHTHRCGGIQITAIEKAPLTADDARRLADEAYRAREFDAAATIVASVRPTDADLQNLALQYERLARAWRTGMDPWVAAVDAFPELREGQKLDVVLGGAHMTEMQDRMRFVAPRAAHEFVTRGDFGNAELALHTAQVLGVDNEITMLVGEMIAGKSEWDARQDVEKRFPTAPAVVEDDSTALSE